MENSNTLTRLVCCAVTAAGLSLGQTTPQTATFNYSGAPIPIATSNVNAPAVAEIYVPATVTVSSVTAQVQIDYPNVADLKVYLYSANGTRTILLNNDCGGLTNVDTTFQDTATNKYSAFCPKEAGRGPFQGDEPLGNSTGEFAAGYWDLVVQNTKSTTNTGLLRTFTLTITGTPVTTPTFTTTSVVNNASFDNGVVAPGEIVSIYGVALGPQQGLQSGSGAAPTSLGGTTVTFDGQPAPILYSSFYQINVQAPYTLVPGARTQIRVQTSTGTSGTITVPVLSSVAGLYTVNSNGRGQIIALNQDGTPNSVTNPASVGTYVSLYATGLGAVTPSVNAGSIASNTQLSTVNGGVTVVIGGLTAPVSFAGLAPGYTGLYQINVQIPQGLAPGPQLVFLVSPNGYSSQARTFIQVQ